MATTIVSTWATEISQLGPIYPFVGSEFLLWIAGLAFWIGFHVRQLRLEAKENALQIRYLRENRLMQTALERD